MKEKTNADGNDQFGRAENTVRSDLKQIVVEQAKKYDCFYLYDEKKINSRIEQLKTDFKSIDFLYSIKANPAKGILRNIFAHGLGADAASLNEVKMANAQNVPAGDLAGPVFLTEKRS